MRFVEAANRRQDHDGARLVAVQAQAIDLDRLQREFNDIGLSHGVSILRYRLVVHFSSLVVAIGKMVRGGLRLPIEHTAETLEAKNQGTITGKSRSGVTIDWDDDDSTSV